MQNLKVLVTFESPIVSQGVCTILRAISSDITIEIQPHKVVPDQLDTPFDLVITDCAIRAGQASCPSMTIDNKAQTKSINIFSDIEEIETSLRNVIPKSARLRDTPRELTPQQERVAKALSQGLVNKQIAEHLNLAEATVRTHITNIFRKLNVKNRTQATNVLVEYFATHLGDNKKEA